MRQTSPAFCACCVARLIALTGVGVQDVVRAAPAQQKRSETSPGQAHDSWSIFLQSISQRVIRLRAFPAFAAVAPNWLEAVARVIFGWSPALNWQIPPASRTRPPLWCTLRPSGANGARLVAGKMIAPDIASLLRLLRGTPDGAHRGWCAGRCPSSSGSAGALRGIPGSST